MIRTLLALLVASGYCLGQTPVINPRGVVNGASFVPGDTTFPLSPGAIVSVFGSNLSALTVSTTQTPLPLMLGDTQVLVDSTPAHLFYVSPNQINFQMPSSGASLQPGQIAAVSVVVKTPTATSAPAPVTLSSSSPGLFTSSSTGCGSIAALNVKLDGSVSVNSPANSLSPGEYLSLFETSKGVGRNNPADGSPAPFNPLAGNAARWITIFDENPFQKGYFRSNQAGGPFAGKAPGLVGVDQENIYVPLNIREGCAVPIRHGPSQLATVSIRNGGGMCVDPAIQSAGDVFIEKVTDLNTPNTMPRNHVIASFSSSPGQNFRCRRISLRPLCTPAHPVPSQTTNCLTRAHLP